MGSRVAAFLLLIIALVNFTLSATSTSADAPHVRVVLKEGTSVWVEG